MYNQDTFEEQQKIWNKERENLKTLQDFDFSKHPCCVRSRDIREDGAPLRFGRAVVNGRNIHVTYFENGVSRLKVYPGFDALIKDWWVD